MAEQAKPEQAQTAEDVKALVAEHDIRFIRFWFTDILGQLKSFSINAAKIDDVRPASVYRYSGVSKLRIDPQVPNVQIGAFSGNSRVQSSHFSFFDICFTKLKRRGP